MKFCRIIMLAFICVLLAQHEAQAAVTGPGIPSIFIPKFDGGPNATPIRTILSMNNLLKGITDWTGEIADDGKKAMGQRSALAGLNAGGQKAMGLYTAHMQRKTGDQRLGVQHKDIMKAFKSRLAGAVLVSMTGLTATTGPVTAATFDSYSNLPRDEKEKDFGKGGTHLEALVLMKKLCDSKGLPQNVSQMLAADSSGAYAGCSTDPELDGKAISLAKMASGEMGARLGPGGKENKPLIAMLGVQRFGKGVQTMMKSENFKSIRELLQADLKGITGQDGKIDFALYDPDEHNSLLHKATTESGSERIIRQFQGVGRAMTGATDVSNTLAGVVKSASLPNPGPDIYAGVAKQNTEFTGNKPCYESGRYASTGCATEMATGAKGRQAEKATKGRMSEGDASGVMSGLEAGMETARVASVAAHELPTQPQGTLTAALEELAMVIDSPEYKTFVASLSKKTLEQVAELARKEMRDSEIQVAANYNAHLYRNGIPVLYAVNGDKFDANMHGILASIGVNADTFLPTGDMSNKDSHIQMASLNPLLDMNKLNPIEPARMQIAVRETVDLAPRVAQSDTLTAALLATPISTAAVHQRFLSRFP